MSLPKCAPCRGAINTRRVASRSHAFPRRRGSARVAPCVQRMLTEKWSGEDRTNRTAGYGPVLHSIIACHHVSITQTTLDQCVCIICSNHGSIVLFDTIIPTCWPIEVMQTRPFYAHAQPTRPFWVAKARGWQGCRLWNAVFSQWHPT